MDRHLHPHHPSKQYSALSSDNFEYDGIEQLKNELVDDDVQGVSMNVRQKSNTRNSNHRDPNESRLAANTQQPQQHQQLANIRQQQFTEANFINDRQGAVMARSSQQKPSQPQEPNDNNNNNNGSQNTREQP